MNSQIAQHIEQHYADYLDSYNFRNVRVERWYDRYFPPHLVTFACPDLAVTFEADSRGKVSVFVKASPDAAGVPASTALQFLQGLPSFRVMPGHEVATQLQKKHREVAELLGPSPSDRQTEFRSWLSRQRL